MKIFVIGGSGFIGTYLVKELLLAGHEVSIFSENPSDIFGELVTIGNVRDQKALNQAFKGIEIVYNLAAEHRDDVRPVSLYYDVNVQGAKNIVEAAERNEVKKIVFTSTVAVYGLNKPEPDENSPTEPFNEYSKSKLEAENVFNQWVEKGGDRSLVIIRPVVIFGEGNKGNVYNLIKLIADNKFVMVGRGDNKKSMGYVRNIAKFLAQMVEFGKGRYLFKGMDNLRAETNRQFDNFRAEVNRGFDEMMFWLELLFGGMILMLAGIFTHGILL